MMPRLLHTRNKQFPAPRSNHSHIDHWPSWTAAALLLLLVQCSQGSLAHAYAIIAKAPTDEETHNTNHPLILASDTDFLAVLLALHKEALSVSKIAAAQAKQKRVQEYPRQSVIRHREQITKVGPLLALHGRNTRPYFYIVPAASRLRVASGNTAGTQCMRVMFRLTSEKIELAKFASGTVKAKPVQRLAAMTIEKNSGELLTLTRWIDRTLFH